MNSPAFNTCGGSAHFPVRINPAGKNPDSPSGGSKTSYSLSTMGCKVNAFESEVIAQKLSAAGYARGDQDAASDVVIVNTCTVTAQADRQARQKVRKIIRDNPDAYVVVTGCYAQTDPQACAAIDGVDLVVGNSQKLNIPDLLAKRARETLPKLVMQDMQREISLPREILQGFEGRSRAFVQIQQGCDQGCTFCIIHTARGPNRSFSMKMIKRQCARLVMNGYREIVLCGVDIGSYGKDHSDPDINLPALLTTLNDIEGEFRLRLSSIDPIHISDELIAVMRRCKKICQQLHLSLQSGNTLILKRMKRRAVREHIIERIGALRRALPGLVLSADIIAGFPTETENQFQDTLKIIDELDIAYPHVFAYSPRHGTPAARIPNQVAVATRKDRAMRARAMGESVWTRIAHTQIGDIRDVIIENSKPSGKRHHEQEQYGGQYTGRSANYFPVVLRSMDKEYTPGELVTVKVTGVEGKSLSAEVV